MTASPIFSGWAEWAPVISNQILLSRQPTRRTKTQIYKLSRSAAPFCRLSVIVTVDVQTDACVEEHWSQACPSMSAKHPACLTKLWPMTSIFSIVFGLWIVCFQMFKISNSTQKTNISWNVRKLTSASFWFFVDTQYTDEYRGCSATHVRETTILLHGHDPVCY